MVDVFCRRRVRALDVHTGVRVRTRLTGATTVTPATTHWHTATVADGRVLFQNSAAPTVRRILRVADAQLPRCMFVSVKNYQFSCEKHARAYNKDRRPFNGLFSRTICVSRHQKGETNLDLMKQEMMRCQWQAPAVPFANHLHLAADR